MSQFQKAIDHAGAASETKRAARRFDPGEAIHNFSQAAAVELGEPGEIEDDARLIRAKNFVKGQLELLALDAHLERATQFEYDDPGLQFFLDDLHRCLPVARKILVRMTENTQLQFAPLCGPSRLPPSLEKPEFPRLRRGSRESYACSRRAHREGRRPSL